MAERPTLDAPHSGKRRPPWAPSCRPHSAPSQQARARAVGLLTGPHARIPRTHSQWVVGPGRTPRSTGGQGWETARPRTPHTKARGAPPGAPSCRPHSAQSQLTRARAVGFVTSPHARTPRTHSQWVVGPGRTPQRTAGRGWEGAQSRTPRQEASPRGTFMPPPQRAKPARDSARCGVGDGSPRLHPPHSQQVGSGPRPYARKEEWSGVGEPPSPHAPHPGKRRPPAGALVSPPQRAKPARKCARCGVADGS